MEEEVWDWDEEVLWGQRDHCHKKSHGKEPLHKYKIKLRQKKELKNISPRTIRRILLEDLGRRAVVAKKKLFLSEVHKRERLDWSRLHLKKSNKFRTKEVMWIDEVKFETKAETGGRLVRRPVGAPIHNGSVWCDWQQRRLH